MSNISELAKRVNSANNNAEVVKARMIDSTHCSYNANIYRTFSIVDVNLYPGKIVYVSLVNNWKAVIVGD